MIDEFNTYWFGDIYRHKPLCLIILSKQFIGRGQEISLLANHDFLLWWQIFWCQQSRPMTWLQWWGQTFRILAKYFDIGQIFWYWRNILILAKYFNICQICWHWPNILILAKYVDNGQICWYYWPNILILAKYFDVCNTFWCTQKWLIYWQKSKVKVIYFDVSKML